MGTGSGVTQRTNRRAKHRNTGPEHSDLLYPATLHDWAGQRKGLNRMEWQVMDEICHGKWCMG